MATPGNPLISSPRCTVWWTPPLADVPTLATLLDDTDRARCAQYAFAPDRARFITGRLLARHALAAELDCDPRAVTLSLRCPICGSAHGKPQVTGDADSVDLSIAHAHERVVVAVGRGCAVGVDVEPIAPLDDLAAVSAEVLAGEERSVLSALAPSERAPAFLCYWTRKEALLKATGHGLALSPSSLCVSAPDSAPALLRGPPELTREGAWMHDLDVGRGYAACVALLGGPPAAVSDEPAPRIDHVRISARELCFA